MGEKWPWKNRLWVLVAAVLLLAGCSSKMYEQYMREGTEALNKEDYERAVSLFEKAYETRETEDVANLFLATKAAKMASHHLGEGKFEEAEVFAEEAISVAGNGEALDALRLFAEEIRKHAVDEKDRKRLIQELQKAKGEMEDGKILREEEGRTVEEEQKNKEKSNITKEEAVQLVIEMTGMRPSESFFVAFDHHTPEGHFVIHLYEVVIDDLETRIGHKATYGWYGVVPETGEVYDYILR